MGWWNWSYHKRGGTITMSLRLAFGLLALFEVISLSVFSSGIFPEGFFSRWLFESLEKSIYSNVDFTIPFLIFSWVEVLFYWYLIGAFIGGIVGKIIRKIKDIDIK
jgi:hypothetical protein